MNFNIGDVVKLKSGSPKMTIDDIGKYNYDDKDKAKCIWFDGSKRFEDIFAFETLELVNT
jgi:uncharacterized protein YodC (DUF2158 family)